MGVLGGLKNVSLRRGVRVVSIDESLFVNLNGFLKLLVPGKNLPV